MNCSGTNSTLPSIHSGFHQSESKSSSIMHKLGAADYPFQLPLGLTHPAPSTLSTLENNILIRSPTTTENENPKPNPEKLLPFHPRPHPHPRRRRRCHRPPLHQSADTITKIYENSRINSSFDEVTLSSHGGIAENEKEINHSRASSCGAPPTVNPNFLIPSAALDQAAGIEHSATSSDVASIASGSTSSFSLNTSAEPNNPAHAAVENSAEFYLIASTVNPNPPIENASSARVSTITFADPYGVCNGASASIGYSAMKDSLNPIPFTKVMSADSIAWTGTPSESHNSFINRIPASPDNHCPENHTSSPTNVASQNPNPPIIAWKNHDSFTKAISSNPNASSNAVVEGSAAASALPRNLAVSNRFDFPIPRNMSVVKNAPAFVSEMAAEGEQWSKLGPMWIPFFVNCQSYFSKCHIHVSQSEENQLEKNQFCIDCVGGPICPRGLKRDHAGHRTLQVRRASKSNAIKAADIQEHIDITGIQQYTINNAKIVFLCKRPSSTAANSVCVKDKAEALNSLHSHGQHSQHFNSNFSSPKPNSNLNNTTSTKTCQSAKPSFDHALKTSCLACYRTLPDSMKFCSLQCKLDCIAQNFQDHQLRRNPKSNIISSLSSFSLCQLPPAGHAIPNSFSPTLSSFTSAARAMEYSRYVLSASASASQSNLDRNHFPGLVRKKISCAAGSMDDMNPALFPLRKRRPPTCSSLLQHNSVNSSSYTNDLSAGAPHHSQKLRACTTDIQARIRSSGRQKAAGGGGEEEEDGNVQKIMVRRSNSSSAEPAIAGASDHHIALGRTSKKVGPLGPFGGQVITDHEGSELATTSDPLSHARVESAISDPDLTMEGRAKSRKRICKPLIVRNSRLNAHHEIINLINWKNSSSAPELSMKADQGYIPPLPLQNRSYNNNHHLQQQQQQQQQQHGDLVKKRLHKRKGLPRRSPFQ